MQSSDYSTWHIYLQIFLDSCDHCWRNTILIECVTSCSCTKAESCDNFLYVPESSGRTLLLPLREAEQVFGEKIIPGDCLGWVRGPLFFELYQKWMQRLPSFSIPRSQRDTSGYGGLPEDCPIKCLSLPHIAQMPEIG